MQSTLRQRWRLLTSPPPCRRKRPGSRWDRLRGIQFKRHTWWERLLGLDEDRGQGLKGLQLGGRLYDVVDLDHQLGRDLQTAWPGMTTVVDLRAMAEVLIDRWASKACPQRCRLHINAAEDFRHLSGCRSQTSGLQGAWQSSAGWRLPTLAS